MFYLLITFLINSNNIIYKPVVKITPSHIAEKYLIPSQTLKKMSEGDLPSKVDLCDKLPEVRTQSSQGSCVAWAVGYYYKTFQEHKENDWKTDLTKDENICSPSFVYNQVNSGNDDGSFPLDAFKLIRTSGCASLKSMPYNPNDSNTLPSKEQQLNALKMRSKSLHFFYSSNNSSTTGKRTNPLTDIEIKAMKKHLSQGDALVISVPYYNEFGDLKSNFFTKDHTASANLDGGHAMVVCGYDDNAGNGSGGFRVKNSWGKNWGEDGLAYLSYDFMKYYSNEAMYMKDRINYQAKTILELDILDIKRSQIAFMTLGDEGNSPLMDFFRYDSRLDFHQIIDLTDLKVKTNDNYLFNFFNIFNNGKTAQLTNLKIINFEDNTIIKDFGNGLPITFSGQEDINILGENYLSIHYDQNAFDSTTMGGKENKEGYLGLEFTFLNEGYLEAIDFFTTHNDTEFELFIYENKDDFLNNKEAYIFHKKGFFSIMGWHTLTLESSLEVKTGTRKFVIIKYKNENGSIIPIEVYPNQNSNSYYSLDGTSLQEIGYAGKIRIRQKLETIINENNEEINETNDRSCNFGNKNKNNIFIYILLFAAFIILRKKELQS